MTLTLLFQEVQKDLQTKGISEAISSVEDLLADRGESLSPEERENLQRALTKMKEQYSALTDSANTSLSDLDEAINNTVQQNTQRVRMRPYFYFFLIWFIESKVNPSVFVSAGKGRRRTPGDTRTDPHAPGPAVLSGPTGETISNTRNGSECLWFPIHTARGRRRVTHRDAAGQTLCSKVYIFFVFLFFTLSFYLTWQLWCCPPGGAAAASGSAGPASPDQPVHQVSAGTARLHGSSGGEAASESSPGAAAGSAPGETAELPGTHRKSWNRVRTGGVNKRRRCLSLLTNVSCFSQERLRKSEALKDEFSKFLQEHGGLCSWLEQSEQELRSLGEGETDAQGLKGRLEEHRKVTAEFWLYSPSPCCLYSRWRWFTVQCRRLCFFTNLKIKQKN